VYIATAHAVHKDHAALPPHAGKAVLCEKPFTTTGMEARTFINLARGKKLLCMEVMWMHVVPAMRKATEMMPAGAIGEPQILTADFGVPTTLHKHGRLFGAGLGGGVMLDCGVHPIALAWRLFGKPDRMQGCPR
jgi:predicted dehydrogenase